MSETFLTKMWHRKGLLATIIAASAIANGLYFGGYVNPSEITEMLLLVLVGVGVSGSIAALVNHMEAQ